MKKKKIIDGNDLIVNSPVSGSEYIRISGINGNIPTIEIKEVKIIGKLQDTKENIELSMQQKVFFDWIKKLKKEVNESE